MQECPYETRNVLDGLHASHEKKNEFRSDAERRPAFLAIIPLPTLCVDAVRDDLDALERNSDVRPQILPESGVNHRNPMRETPIQAQSQSTRGAIAQLGFRVF